MPLKVQAHVDSKIWSLQSTVSFFSLSSIWYSEVLFAFKLGLQRVYFFQNVRKMHFFPMFRNGVKWHKCHIPLNTIRCPAFPYVQIFGLLRIPFLCCGPSQVHQWHYPKKKNNKKNNNNKTKQPPPPQKKIKTTTTTKKTTKKQQQTNNRQDTTN